MKMKCWLIGNVFCNYPVYDCTLLAYTILKKDKFTTEPDFSIMCYFATPVETDFLLQFIAEQGFGADCWQIEGM